jgi:predicted phosphodiesterase
MSGHVDRRTSRRLFLQGSSLLLLSNGRLLADTPPGAPPDALVGLLTDVHYADKPAAGSRHYRDSLEKLEEAVEQFERSGPKLLIELGDLIDAGDTLDQELAHLATANAQLAKLRCQRYFVLGNHCVDTLTKSEFLTAVGQTHSYLSLDQGGFHLVILDACFRRDGQPYGRRNFEWTDANVTETELGWLQADLARNSLPVVVFIHQRLDDPGPHGVRNAPQVRKVLEDSGNVVAVFQGHSHHNDLRVIEGIAYCTLAAMVEGAAPESSGYGLLSLWGDGSLMLEGFRRQSSYRWPAAGPGHSPG